jgi:protein CpxP
MKKLILIVIALVTINVTAQEHRKEHKEQNERGERRAMLKDLTPEEMATLQTKKMTLHLELTSAQQTKILTLNLEQAKLRKAKMDAHKKRMDNAGSKPSKDERLKMMNDKLDHQIVMKQKIKGILTAEQFEKWEQSQANHEGRSHQNKKMKKHK